MTGTEEGGVCKGEKGIVFCEIVLNGCAGEDDAALDVKGGECCEGLGVAVFETVTFVAEHEAYRCGSDEIDI